MKISSKMARLTKYITHGIATCCRWWEIWKSDPEKSVILRNSESYHHTLDSSFRLEILISRWGCSALGVGVMCGCIECRVGRDCRCVGVVCAGTSPALPTPTTRKKTTTKTLRMCTRKCCLRVPPTAKPPRCTRCIGCWWQTVTRIVRFVAQRTFLAQTIC